MECKKCKLQYVGKAERELSLRINNHPNNVLKLIAVPADRHFALRDHDSNTDTKFTIKARKLLDKKPRNCPSERT